MSGQSVFAKRLRQARSGANLSQKKLGILAGIDEFSASARINQYEQGKHMPDFRTTTRLADVLGIPVPFLFSEDEDLADTILLIGQLNAGDRKTLLRALRKRALGKNAK